MAEHAPLRAITCSSGWTDRALRAAVAVIMLAFAVSMRDTPVPAVLAALVAVTAAAGAVTGRCPADLLSRRASTSDDARGRHGFPEARQHFDLS